MRPSLLSFPHDCSDLLPAQVSRSARRRSTSRLHERARHVWRRGIVKRLLRYRLEGHFRSQSFISRILIDATPWHEQWGVRHDLYARMRELPSKFEGVETVDVGTLPRRVRRENPDITSPLTNKRARQILSHFHRYLELRVSRRPRSFAKRVRKWAISKERYHTPLCGYAFS